MARRTPAHNNKKPTRKKIAPVEIRLAYPSYIICQACGFKSYKYEIWEAHYLRKHTDPHATKRPRTIYEKTSR